MKKERILTLVALLLFLVTPVFADLDDTLKNKIPSDFYRKCPQAGKTELLIYETGSRQGKAVVYLPYGYDDENSKVKYPVLYLMHGGGGSYGSYLGPATTPNTLANIIDNCIYSKLIEPIIIVCPQNNGNFHLEFKKFLIPAVDSKYKTIPKRENRAFGGFSMGGVETWSIFAHDLNLVKYFIPMSGDSWIAGTTGGKNNPDMTARFLSKANFISEYDYYIFAATGDKDTAYVNLTPQIQAMKKLPEYFKYTTGNFSKGNLIYYVAPDHMHDYGQTYEYLYNGLQLFFPKNGN